MSFDPVHIAENRNFWNDHAPQWVERGHRAWVAEPRWGTWSVPESELGLLPDDLTGQRSIELGCGTGYVSAWLARRGAAATAVDLSEEQLSTAAGLSAEHGLPVQLVHANAEATPFRDEQFDFGISEYGAAIWCDPHVWIPEARRLLRPGGRLVIFGNHPLAMVCAAPDGSDIDDRLHRPYFRLHSIDWREAEEDPGGIEFNLPISEWMTLFTEVGFTVERYIEVRAPAGDEDTKFFVPRSWARQWPAEQAWILSLPT